MFKLTLIIQNLRKTTRILNNSTIRRCSINLSNQNKEINLKEQSNESISFEKSTKLKSTSLRTTDLENFKNSLEKCRSVNELFNFIKPNIAKFKNDEIVSVFESINYLYQDSIKNQSIFSLNEFSKDLQNSNIFKLLLDHSNQQIKQLDDSVLKDLIKLFFWLINIRKVQL